MKIKHGPKKGATKKWSERLEELGNQALPQELMEKLNTTKLDDLTIVEKIDQISSLQIVKTPWHVMRLFGNIEMFGNQVSIRPTDSSDYVSLEEAQDAVSWLAEQLGGKVTWKKEEKDFLSKLRDKASKPDKAFIKKALKKSKKGE